MRILGIDYGTRRLGLALSDELLLTAGPFAVIPRKSLEQDLREIERVVLENDVQEIVVGHPVNLRGESGAAAEQAREFSEVLQARFEIPVRLWDERFSTVAAERVLIDADLSRSRRKKVIDSVAAAYFLQGYLDCRRSNPEGTGV